MTTLAEQLIASIAHERAKRGVRAMVVEVFLVVDSTGQASCGLSLDEAWCRANNLDSVARVVKVAVEVSLPTVPTVTVSVPDEDDEPLKLKDG